MFRFLTLLLLAACAVDNPGAAAPAPRVPMPVPTVVDSVPVPTPPVAPPSEGTLVLAAGEQAELDADASLRYDKLVNDSRCPAGVQCVWAGEVRLALTLTVAGKAEAFELAGARENAKTVQGYAIELLEYGPCPLGHAAAPKQQECASLKSTRPPEDAPAG